jgi:uncharacterized protein (TIGR03089 family)
MSSPASPTATTFSSALAVLLRTSPGRPLVTYYDDATGERIELSVATYANWVAKTAGLAQDELDLTRGDLVVVDLPTHWLGAVWLGAAWTLGLIVTDDPGVATDADLVVCGPTPVERYAENAGRVPVVALALRPLGGPFTQPLPPGVTDYGAVVLAQPDAFAAYDPPAEADPAWRDGDDTLTQGDLLAEAVRSAVVSPGGRLITDVNPVSRPGTATVLAPVALDAATVWVRHPDEAGWAAHAEQERATEELRGQL